MQTEDLFAYWYSTSYYIVLLFICCYAIREYSNESVFLNKKIAWPLASGVILFLAFRPLTSKYGFGDTKGYAFFFNLHKNLNEVTYVGTNDYGFELLSFVLRNGEVWMLFLIMGIIYVIPQLVACKKLTSEHYGLLFLILVCSFSFWGYGVNGMRNGAALSLIMLGIVTGNVFLTAILFLCGFSFHASALLPIVAYIISYIYKNTKGYLWLWCISLILSFFISNLLTQYIPLGDFIGDKRVSYLTNSFDETNINIFSNTGYRWDFVLYSAIPIVIGSYYVLKGQTTNLIYQRILNTYILCNSVWLFTIHIPYNNRFAYLSWFLFPLIISYPYLQEDELSEENISNLKKILGFTYLFTFLMWLR